MRQNDAKLRDTERSRTRYEPTLEERYNAYRVFADDGKGGDITRNGEPLLTFDEWLEQ